MATLLLSHNEERVDQCLGYLAYPFKNQEVNNHAGNLITICLMHGWQRNGAGSAIIDALFVTDVSSSQYTSK